MQTDKNVIVVIVIGISIIMCGCVDEGSNRTYIGYSLDVGFTDGRYEQYNNVIDVNTVYEDRTGYYTRKITFSDGSYKTYSMIVDESISEGLLYNSITLHFKDGSMKHLDYVIGYETIDRIQPYMDIVLTFADGSKRALHNVRSYRSI